MFAVTSHGGGIQMVDDHRRRLEALRRGLLPGILQPEGHQPPAARRRDPGQPAGRRWHAVREHRQRIGVEPAVSGDAARDHGDQLSRRMRRPRFRMGAAGEFRQRQAAVEAAAPAQLAAAQAQHLAPVFLGHPRSAKAPAGTERDGDLQVQPFGLADGMLHEVEKAGREILDVPFLVHLPGAHDLDAAHALRGHLLELPGNVGFGQGVARPPPAGMRLAGPRRLVPARLEEPQCVVSAGRSRDRQEEDRREHRQRFQEITCEAHGSVCLSTSLSIPTTAPRLRAGRGRKSATSAGPFPA